MKSTSATTIRGSHASGSSGVSPWGLGQSIEFYDIEPRVSTLFLCEAGHKARYEFHTSAELPLAWPCKRCGAEAVRIEPPNPNPRPQADVETQHQPVRPGAWYTRKHLREVIERRSPKQLEALLAERLALRRAAIGAVPEQGDPAA